MSPTSKPQPPPINWLQVAAIVVPVLLAALGSYLHADRRITVVEQQMKNHINIRGHVAAVDRITGLERTQERLLERFDFVDKQLAEIKAELRRR